MEKHYRRFKGSGAKIIRKFWLNFRKIGGNCGGKFWEYLRKFKFQLKFVKIFRKIYSELE